MYTQKSSNKTTLQYNLEIMTTGGNSITTIENNGDFSRSLWHLRTQLINQSPAQTSLKLPRLKLQNSGLPWLLKTQQIFSTCYKKRGKVGFSSPLMAGSLRPVHIPQIMLKEGQFHPQSITQFILQTQDCSGVSSKYTKYTHSSTLVH